MASSTRPSTIVKFNDRIDASLTNAVGSSLHNRVSQTENAFELLIEDDKTQGPPKRCLFYAGSRIKNRWDVFVGVALIYTSIVTPFRCGSSPPKTTSHH